jgi:anti-sigma factor RsiW
MNDTDRQVSRYVDGEMGRDEAAAFEARLRDAGDLRQQVDGIRALRDLFEPERRAARAESLRPYRPSSRLRARVLAGTVRGPAPVREDEAVVVARAWGQRVLYAAAALVFVALAGAAWTLGSVGTGRLEASPAELQRTLDELDARIRAGAEAVEGR